jgi:hypothetical protein
VKASEALVIGGFYVDAQIRQPKYSFAVRFNKIASTGNNISRSYKKLSEDALIDMMESLVRDLVKLLADVKTFTKDDFELFRGQWYMILQDLELNKQKFGKQGEQFALSVHVARWETVVHTLYTINAISVSLTTILDLSNLLDEKLNKIKLPND